MILSIDKLLKEANERIYKIKWVDIWHNYKKIIKI
jgi:hypothetical protein